MINILRVQYKLKLTCVFTNFVVQHCNTNNTDYNFDT